MKVEQFLVGEMANFTYLLIDEKNNSCIIVDPSWDLDVIYEYLKKHSLKIVFIINTHSHFDHYGGIGKIYDRCTVAQVMFNDISTGTSSWEALKEKFKNNSEENSFIGDEYLLGSVHLKILWPGKDILEKRVKNLNNTSLVIFLDYKDYEALFLGDLEADALKEIDISDITGLIQGKLDLLKVSHHGSNTGYYRPLVEQLDPIYCVISVGKDNKFNHPHKEALESYEELGCKVLRTDIEGDIVIKTE